DAPRRIDFDGPRRAEVVDHRHRFDAASPAALQAGSPATLRPSDIIRHRISRAFVLRQSIIRGDTDCYRLINGDGDGLSGVVVDRYADVLVLQLLTAGADAMRATLVSALNELL